MLPLLTGLLNVIPVVGPIAAGVIGLAANFLPAILKPVASVAGDVEKDAVGLGTAILGNQTAMDVIAGAAIAGLAFLAFNQHGEITAGQKALAVAQAQAAQLSTCRQSVAALTAGLQQQTAQVQVLAQAGAVKTAASAAIAKTLPSALAHAARQQTEIQSADPGGSDVCARAQALDAAFVKDALP